MQPRSCSLQRLPVQVHGARRIGFGAQPYPNAQMDARLPAVRVVKERLLRAPANADGATSAPTARRGSWRTASARRWTGPIRGLRSAAKTRSSRPTKLSWRRRRDVSWRYVNGIGWVREQIDRMIVLTLVQRGGRSRSFNAGRDDGSRDLSLLDANISRRSTLATDEGTWYTEMGRELPEHLTVAHRRKSTAGAAPARTRSKAFSSIFKRGMKGIYQHCAKKHLHRYLCEFDFRYANRIRFGVDDAERPQRAIKGAEGRRLYYRQPRSRAA